MRALLGIFFITCLFLSIGCGGSLDSNVDRIIDVDLFTKEYMQEKMKGLDTITRYEGAVCTLNCIKIQYNDRAYAILDGNEKLVLFSWINDDSIVWDDHLDYKLGIENGWHKVKNAPGFRKYIGDNGYDIMLKGQNGIFESLVITRSD